jgi:hypothetical protein
LIAKPDAGPALRDADPTHATTAIAARIAIATLEAGRATGGGADVDGTGFHRAAGSR